MFFAIYRHKDGSFYETQLDVATLRDAFDSAPRMLPGGESTDTPFVGVKYVGK